MGALSKVLLILFIVVALLFVTLVVNNTLVGASNNGPSVGEPSIRSVNPTADTLVPDNFDEDVLLEDNRLTAEVVAKGLSFPTSMAFVADQSVIVLEKDSGSVYLLSFGGSTEKKKLLNLSVANGTEQGLLGVAVADRSAAEHQTLEDTLVFLYLTESDGDGNLVGNRVYRYEWNAETKELVNPTLVVQVPDGPGYINNGGKLVVSNEGHLYVVIGDMNRVAGPTQNKVEGDGLVETSSVILRVDFEGKAIDDNPFVHYGKTQLSQYYAYGIRNSFGMAIDPVTGTLWATENGQEDNDEINIVYPGFNSGWSSVMGPIDISETTEDDLFFLEGARYDDPVFTWRQPVGPTDIEFLNSDMLGEEYRNNIFVGDINGGALYYFGVNESRTGLDLSDHPELSDGVAETYEEGFLARIGSFPGGITHLETGPDGFLYVLTFGGSIYRIMPAS